MENDINPLPKEFKISLTGKEIAGFILQFCLVCLAAIGVYILHVTDQ